MDIHVHVHEGLGQQQFEELRTIIQNQGQADMARDQETLALVQQLNDVTNQMAQQETEEGAHIQAVADFLQQLKDQLAGGVTPEGTAALESQLGEVISRAQQALAISTANQASLAALGQDQSNPVPDPVPVEPPTDDTGGTTPPEDTGGEPTGRRRK